MVAPIGKCLLFPFGPGGKDAKNEEKNIAQGLLKELDDSHIYDKPHAVELLPAKAFYKAEEYHQKYLVKNPGGYDNHYLRKISFDSK